MLINFNPGPAMIPAEVLKQAQRELLDWRQTGISILETGHRSAEFVAFQQEIEQRLRDLLEVPDYYHILFMQGGARGQFAMVPLNLIGDRSTVDYVDTGLWSRTAIEEAKKYAQVNVVASSQNTIPPRETWRLTPEAAYLHYVSNETVSGLQFPQVPKGLEDIPLVADMSSDFLSRPIPIEEFGVIYASTPKNLGASGLAVVIVREDLLNRALPITPSFCHYQQFVKTHSLYQTPPTFSWYLLDLMVQWIHQQGGLARIEQRNHIKAARLYTYLDQSEFYRTTIDPQYRSAMNVTFTLAESTLEPEFLQQAKAQGLLGLKGHSTVGGLRASLYNAMPESGVEALCQFMKAFEAQYG